MPDLLDAKKPHSTHRGQGSMGSASFWTSWTLSDGRFIRVRTRAYNSLPHPFSFTMCSLILFLATICFGRQSTSNLSVDCWLLSPIIRNRKVQHGNTAFCDHTMWFNWNRSARCPSSSSSSSNPLVISKNIYRCRNHGSTLTSLTAIKSQTPSPTSYIASV